LWLLEQSFILVFEEKIEAKPLQYFPHLDVVKGVVAIVMVQATLPLRVFCDE
jgi:hypothetical protein